MNIQMFTVHDRITDDSCPPFGVRNEAMAVKMFLELQKNVLEQHEFTDIRDYKLFAIGSYDTTTMKLKGFEAPEAVDLTEAYKKLENYQKGQISMATPEELKLRGSSSNQEGIKE